jgi:hypothetical protein
MATERKYVAYRIRPYSVYVADFYTSADYHFYTEMNAITYINTRIRRWNREDRHIPYRRHGLRIELTGRGDIRRTWDAIDVTDGYK